MNSYMFSSQEALINIILHDDVPLDWPKGQKISYKICFQVISKVEHYSNDNKLLLSEYQTTKNALKCLDQNIIFPVDVNFSNFKKKVKGKKRRESDGVVVEFYGSSAKCQENIGHFCEELGLTVSIYDKIVNDLIDNDVLDVKGKVTSLNNGVALEIFKFAEKKYKISDSRKNFYHLCGGPIGDFSDNSLYLSYINLKKKVDNAKQSCSSVRKDVLMKIENDRFIFPKTAHELYEEYLNSERRECDEIVCQYKKKIEKLKSDWQCAEEKNNCLTDLLLEQDIAQKDLCEKNTELAQKLKESRELFQKSSDQLHALIAQQNSFSTKEVNRCKKRREAQISKLKGEKQEYNVKYRELLYDSQKLEEQVKQKDEEMKNLVKDLVNEMAEKRKYQKQKSFYKNLARKSNKNKDLLDHDTKIKELHGHILLLENEKLEIEDHLESLLQNELPELKNADGSYKNNVRAMFQDLVLCGVGIKETKNVITTVLRNMLNIQVDHNQLPSASFARSMYEEARLLAMAQVGTTVPKDLDSNNTIQTDGTTKHNNHYLTVDMRTKEGVNMVVATRPVASGDSETQMDVLREIFAEIEKVCEGNETNVAKKLVTSIKNTMSDRHIVQKKFNSLLEEYRAELLPEVIKNWAELSEEEQKNLKKLNEFFCGLHYIVGLADQAESCLKSFEKLKYDDELKGSLAHGGYSKGESGTLRLVRTLCKAVQEQGCEKSGRKRDFDLALKEKGVSKNPLIHFKGNRFNVLFYNGGIAYYLHEHCVDFFKDVLDDNKLLRAVHYDVNEPLFIVGCRALGLINKFITGPLWRLFVKVDNILLMNKYYQELAQKFPDLSKDASEFLKGNVTFFDDDSLISKDEVYEKLLIPSDEYDESTQQLLELLFASFSVITVRMLHDHLERGKYDNPSSKLMLEAASCPNTDAYPETNFGCLDRLMVVKPRCNDITYEAIIMCRSNNMPHWRDSLSDSDKEKWMEWVKLNKKHHYQQFLERRTEIRRLRNEKRLSNIEEKKKKAIKTGQVKEQLYKKLNECGGLWESPEDIESNLMGIKVEREKTEALKCQLKFRQKVLCNTYVDSDLYLFSKDKKKRTNLVLQKNLEMVIAEVNAVSATLAAAENQDSGDGGLVNLTIPIAKLDKEKDRLQLLHDKELLKQEKKSMAPPLAKKQKVDNLDVPVKILPEINCAEDLIGKRVSHFIADGKKKAKWHNATVVCRKPGSDSELVLRYDGYDSTLYSFEFWEFADELVELLPLDPEYAYGKIIQHRFYNEADEDDYWWEKGRIIGIKDCHYTVNYFNENVEDLDLDVDMDIDVYETLVIPLEEDYINNDIRFL